MANTPQIGCKLTLVDANGVVLEQWNMDDWNVARGTARETLGWEIHEEIVRAAKAEKAMKRVLKEHRATP